MPACVGHYRSEANKSVLARAETRDKPAQAGVVFADKNDMTEPNFGCGFTCDYPPDDEDEFTTCCPPDFVCNDVVDSVTGMMDTTGDVRGFEVLCCATGSFSVDLPGMFDRRFSLLVASACGFGFN